MYLFYGDVTYILIITGAVLSLLASGYVKLTVNRYLSVQNRRGITGKEVAEMILQKNGLYDVQVGCVSGTLTDHYNPKTKVVNLSSDVYHSYSISAAGIAAHECGHAIQHDKGYAPMSLRSSLVPVVNFGSRLSWPLVILGFLLNGNVSLILIKTGIILFGFVVLFQLVTLPVELDASHRALKEIVSYNILDTRETSKARKVLFAAALTYVAAAASALLQLLRLLLITRGRRNR